MTLYDRTGFSYDTTRRADPYLAGRLSALLGITANGTYLDIACGTGNYTAVVARQGGQWHGVDFSTRMLNNALGKSRSIQWTKADAHHLPLVDKAFSGAMCTLALHNFRDLAAAFKETYRVLISGKFLIFTTTPDQMRGYWLNEYFRDAMAKATQQMPALDLVLEALKDAGFSYVETEFYQVSPGLQYLFLYSGKHRPEVYLDPEIREGISAFSSLADPSEVEEGCRRLSEDIQSGQIGRVMRDYENSGGDYLFVIAEKP
ncbi:MAG: methyltransferase type 11 [SAR202 cluster bacterium Io17-Chloro-G9]|nr:MAG: methyltransferase type 11 [SAR202 cluster bacterium Io17-Chloro-G9]